MKKKVNSARRNINQAAADEDPLAQLGFGIVAYINILYSMIWAFVLFSLMLLPTMMNYKTGDNYLGDPRAGHATGMISNLGYSTVECNNTPLSLGKTTLYCPYGVIGTIMEYGINDEKMGSPPDACVNNQFNSKCKPNSSLIARKLE